jgi:hypothetical protein
MNNIALELEALTSEAPAALTDKHDKAMLLWALETIDDLPEQPRDREEEIEALSREVCVIRIELLESEMDRTSVGGGCDPSAPLTIQGGV